MEPDYDDPDLCVSEEERQEGEDLAVLEGELEHRDREAGYLHNRVYHGVSPKDGVDLSWLPGEEPF
jgi:hypothetical protein